MQPSTNRQWTPSKVLSLLLLAIIAVYLLTEHTVHFFGALPYLLFLGCPLMMFFMMRGMGGGDHQPPPDR